MNSPWIRPATLALALPWLLVVAAGVLRTRFDTKRYTALSIDRKLRWSGVAPTHLGAALATVTPTGMFKDKLQDRSK